MLYQTQGRARPRLDAAFERSRMAITTQKIRTLPIREMEDCPPDRSWIQLHLRRNKIAILIHRFSDVEYREDGGNRDPYRI